MDETIKVAAAHLADRMKRLMHEDQVSRIILNDDRGHTFFEVPLSAATRGVIAVPVLAAMNALAGVVSEFTIIARRTPPAESVPTEDQVDMKDTMAQRLDKKGTRAEDAAGVGEHDSKGG